jgi:hypothetical protein
VEEVAVEQAQPLQRRRRRPACAAQAVGQLVDLRQHVLHVQLRVLVLATATAASSTGRLASSATSVAKYSSAWASRSAGGRPWFVPV